MEREPGTRAPGVDPGDARAKRAPAARGSSGLGTLQARLHAPAGPRVSRHSCPDVVSAPTRAARSAAAEPIRTQAPGRTAPPAAAGAGAAAGGGEKRCRVERAPDPRRSRSSGRPARTPTGCTKKFMRLPPPRPRRGRSVVRTASATVGLVVKTLASRTASAEVPGRLRPTKSRTRNLT